ncbi:putative pheophorbide a oxygenase [Helianthus debilis subsp. tardiflorus]
MKVGQSNWQKACFVPTKADANMVAYRKWMKKYADTQIDLGTEFDGYLPRTANQFMDRLFAYWSHVVNYSCCNGAYKGFECSYWSHVVNYNCCNSAYKGFECN